jgi:hypothetical protein
MKNARQASIIVDLTPGTVHVDELAIISSAAEIIELSLFDVFGTSDI